MSEDKRSDVSRDRILERVKKLMNLAEDGAASEGEVENAMRFARKLMADFDISSDELEDLQDVLGDLQETVCNERRRYAPWERHLLIVCDKICDTRHIIKSRESNGSTKQVLCFVGYARDCAIAKAMWQTFLVSVRTMAKNNYGAGWSKQHQSYAEGYVAKLMQMAAELKEQAADPASGQIVLRKDLAVNDFFSKLFPKTGTIGGRARPLDHASYSKGVHDASRVNLRKEGILGGDF